MNGMFSKGFSIEDSERPGCVSPFTGSGNKREIKVQKIDQEGENAADKRFKRRKTPTGREFSTIAKADPVK